MALEDITLGHNDSNEPIVLTWHNDIELKLIKIFAYFSGTDEKAIIDVLAHRTNSERLQIKDMFKTMYGKVRDEVAKKMSIVQ